jgi:protein-tyrosine-phosphatase
MLSSNEDRDGRSRAAWLRRAAKRVIPKRVVEEVLQYRKYKPHERPLYIKLRIANGLGFKKPKKAPVTARSFLFVCFGNIMRSPMCEALMKRAIGKTHVDVRVQSAGLNATPGTPAHPWSVVAAREFDIDLSQHRSRLLSPEMLDQADAIFAMDYRNQVELLCRYPALKDRVFMLSAYAGEGYRPIEIRDPFFGDQAETRRCYAILQRCVENLVATLAADAKRDLVATPNGIGLGIESGGSRRVGDS